MPCSSATGTSVSARSIAPTRVLFVRVAARAADRSTAHRRVVRELPPVPGRRRQSGDEHRGVGPRAFDRLLHHPRGRRVVGGGDRRRARGGGPRSARRPGSRAPAVRRPRCRRRAAATAATVPAAAGRSCRASARASRASRHTRRRRVASPNARHGARYATLSGLRGSSGWRQRGEQRQSTARQRSRRAAGAAACPRAGRARPAPAIQPTAAPCSNQIAGVVERDTEPRWLAVAGMFCAYAAAET